MRVKPLFTSLLTFALCLHAQTLTPEVKKAIDSIQPAELKGDLSFLASDLLQGRFTPSPGLDIAAEFIASKFRAAGLEPGGNDNTYFQLAEMVDRTLPKVVTPLAAKDGDKSITVEPNNIQVAKASAAASVKDAPVVKITARDADQLKGVNLDGKVVLVPSPDLVALAAPERMNVYRKMQAFDKAVAASKAVMELVVVKALRPSQSSRLLFADEAFAAMPPVVQIESPELADAVKTSAALTVSLDIPAPEDQKSTVKNVIGVLRGSDPALKSTCVLVTAHYDHIGTTDTAKNLGAKPKNDDKIYNGANDDGSGTVSVIEIARALSGLHPKRSIVLMTFFGEERGELGSTYYGRHPLFPISKTVADINLEQVGRTDSTEGTEVANASITGYDYSDVTRYLEAAGKLTGIKIYKDAAASDEYFVRSDNAALAEQGVPAHTLCTAFNYPRLPWRRR